MHSRKFFSSCGVAMGKQTKVHFIIVFVVVSKDQLKSKDEYYSYLIL